MNPARISLVARSAARSLRVQRRSFAVLAQEPTAASIVVPPAVKSSYSPLQDAIAAKEPRNNWTKAEIESIYNTGTLELAFAAVRLPPGGRGGLSAKNSGAKAYTGNHPPQISQSLRHPNVHAHEHQDGRL